MYGRKVERNGLCNRCVERYEEMYQACIHAANERVNFEML